MATRSGQSSSPAHASEHPPRSLASVTSTSGKNRRRSTTSVFADPSRLSPPLSNRGQSIKEHTPVRSKARPQDSDSVLSREVQQDALELSGTLTEDAEAQEREELAEILAQGDWAPSEVALFKRLRRRGREPLLPAPWRLDFTTFPEVLYAPVGEISFICALTPSAAMEFRGSQALQRLVNIGGQVRDRTEINPSALVEPLIYQEIRNFLSWAEKDGDISVSSILTLNYNRNKNGDSRITSEKTERKMKAMARDLQAKHPETGHVQTTPNNSFTPEASRSPLVIYGITVYNCVAALSSLSCDNVDADVKTHVVLDWTDVGLDIWNAIAIAILIICCRNDILDSEEGARLKLVQYADDDA